MNVTFLGGGNMAQAIIGGLLRRPETTPSSLRVVELDPRVRHHLEDKHPGVLCYQRGIEALRETDIIVLAVKPHQIRAAIQGLGIEANAHLVISIAAGVTVATLGQWDGKGHTRFVRAMPNTPALIGAGITALYSPSTLSIDDRSAADTVLSAVGKTIWVDDEDEINVVTAISGSGPAYVFMFMEALEDAATELKLPSDVARRLVLQTFVGAVQLAAAGAESLADLRARVTSKGGTTEAALASFARDQTHDAIVRAVKAAYDRSRVLGKEMDES
jgi:pyrroline-5-carboxylate reductase